MDDRSVSRRAKRDALTPSHCEIPDCEYVKFFQRHRIVPGRDGGKYKLGNVIALCPNHHAEADAGLLEPGYLVELVRLRIEKNAASEQSIDTATECGASDSPVFGDRSSEESGESPGERASDAGDGLEEGLS